MALARLLVPCMFTCSQVLRLLVDESGYLIDSKVRRAASFDASAS